VPALYLRAEGVLVAPMGHLWAAFSPTSGETMLLNDEGAAILELLEAGSLDSDAVCTALAADSGLPADTLTDLVRASWPRLMEAGLVRELRDGHVNPR
jgi:PqqD family protein of HPr-rel-A system